MLAKALNDFQRQIRNPAKPRVVFLEQFHNTPALLIVIISSLTAHKLIELLLSRVTKQWVD
jgi:hypothetical protein